MSFAYITMNKDHFALRTVMQFSDHSLLGGSIFLKYAIHKQVFMLKRANLHISFPTFYPKFAIH